MMTHEEREAALAEMKLASDRFYFAASHIGNHPFIEFTGLMNEYINMCRDAHARGVDFSECNTHSGQDLPMKPHQIAYVNEKLECIFTGRSVVNGSDELAAQTNAALALAASLQAAVQENTVLRDRVNGPSKEIKSFLITVAQGFDCDEDAHRYGTFCRACEAKNLLGEPE